jgi:AcrR family transcriptional regulator
MTDTMGGVGDPPGAGPRARRGRRERKTEATRRALEDAAWALFDERGFVDTTIEDITERVDVSVRTFFRHFPSKESVLFGDPRALEGPFRRALIARPATENPCRALRAALRELAPLVETQRDRHLLRHRILEQPGGPKIEDHLGAITEKGMMLREIIADRTGGTVDDPGTQLLAGLVVTVMDVVYRQWITTDARADIADLVDSTFDCLADLITPTMS